MSRDKSCFRRLGKIVARTLVRAVRKLFLVLIYVFPHAAQGGNCQNDSIGEQTQRTTIRCDSQGLTRLKCLCGPRAAHHRGTCSHHHVFPHQARGSLTLLRARHLGDEKQDSVPSSASVADFVSASPNKGNTVSQSCSSSTSPSSRMTTDRFLAKRPDPNILDALWDVPFFENARQPPPSFLGALWDVPVSSQTPDNPREATNLVSLLATNHTQLFPRKHVSPTRSVPLRRFVQALVVCCGCRLRLRLPLHQATDSGASAWCKRHRIPRFRAPTHSSTRMFACGSWAPVVV